MNGALPHWPVQWNAVGVCCYYNVFTTGEIKMRFRRPSGMVMVSGCSLEGREEEEGR